MYTWINHHIEQGHGPPNFFITLSYAEYLWPDIKRLIKERLTIAGLDVPDLNTSFVQIINDYTLIVQEYFQERVKIWLSTIGAKVFHIKHYWLRYELALSRGQIHAHMLAIHDNPKVMEPYYDNTINKKKQEEFLYQWMTEELGMTASFSETLLGPISKTELHPSKLQYKDITNTSKKDFLCCLQKLQYHKCSVFCIRKCYVL